MEHPTQRLDPNDPDLPGQGTTICPRCSGSRVWAKTNAYTRVPVMIRKIDAGLFDNGHECVPLVCTTCGYTEFYTQNPQTLAE